MNGHHGLPQQLLADADALAGRRVEVVVERAERHRRTASVSERREGRGVEGAVAQEQEQTRR